MIEKFIKERKLDVSPYTNANNDLMSLTSQAMGFSKNRIKLDQRQSHETLQELPKFKAGIYGLATSQHKSVDRS